MKDRENKTLKKVLITDPIHPDAVLRLQKENFEVTELTENQKTELKNIIKPYDAIICRTSTTIGVTEFNNAQNLKCIALASTGFDRLDAKEALRRNIPILGLPPYNPNIDPEHDGNFVSTAEHTILLILAALGDFSHAYQSMKEGRWEKKFLVGNELADKTVGLVGLGRIASLVAKRLKGFRVNIIARDPFVSQEKAASLGVKLVTAEELYKQSDIISIHLPKTPDTVGMINDEAFKLMKDGIFIVNTARAAIIDEKALIKALNKGKVRRVALDVFHDEPTGINQELIKHPSVIATPHIGGSTHEAWRRISLSTADNVISYFHGIVRNQLNPPNKAIILAAGASTRLRPLTDNKSKSMLMVGEKTILDHQIEVLLTVGVRELAIVVGYKKQEIIDHLKQKNYPLHITYIHNDNYISTTPLESLWLAREHLKEPVLFLHCDVLFEPKAIYSLLSDPYASTQLYRKDYHDIEAGKIIVDKNGYVQELGKQIVPSKASGEYLQVAKFGQKFLDKLTIILNQRVEKKKGGYTIDAFNDVVQGESRISKGVVFNGFAMEIDTVDDYEKAKRQYLSIK